MPWGVVVLLGILALLASAPMAYAIKPGVSGRIRDEMAPVMDVVPFVWRLHRLGTPTLTSVEDGEHSVGSKHYQGLALDWRLEGIAPGLHMTLRDDIAAMLPPGFDVLYEYPGAAKTSVTWPASVRHIHIEWDPK